MKQIPPILDEAESFVHTRAEALTRPREKECLCCFVARQLNEFGCDGSHRHALHYRDAMAPRATKLRERLREIGACCCDCELFMNGYQLRGTDADLDLDVLPPCEGVSRGSVQPCRNWVRIRRW